MTNSRLTLSYQIFENLYLSYATNCSTGEEVGPGKGKLRSAMVIGLVVGAGGSECAGYRRASRNSSGEICNSPRILLVVPRGISVLPKTTGAVRTVSSGNCR